MHYCSPGLLESAKADTCSAPSRHEGPLRSKDCMTPSQAGYFLLSTACLKSPDL